MNYHALAIGLSDHLFNELSIRLTQYDLHFTLSTTTSEASYLLNKRTFHLLIVDLEYLRKLKQIEWLSNIRRISFAPVIVLTDTPDQDMSHMIELGMDICISDKQSHSMIADLIHAQLRRYTEYNHYDAPGSAGAEAAPFQAGDIFIYPPRRAVKVQGRPVDLRPASFLYYYTL